MVVFSLIDLTNTPVLATGADTVGLTSLDLRPATTNVVTLTGGSLISTESTAVQAQGPLNLSTSGTVAAGGGGLLIEAFASTFGPAQPTIVQFDASAGSILTGDALANPLTAINLNLTTGSHWTGAALPITNTTVDPTSTWTVTADSVVTRQTSNAGLIEFTPPVGGLFKTLTRATISAPVARSVSTPFSEPMARPPTASLSTAAPRRAIRCCASPMPAEPAHYDRQRHIGRRYHQRRHYRAGHLCVVRPCRRWTLRLHAFPQQRRCQQRPGMVSAFGLDCTLDPTNPVCQQPGPDPGPTPEPPNFRPETSLYAAIRP